MVTCRGRVLTENDCAFVAESGAKMLWSVAAGISLPEMEKRLIGATLQQTEGIQRRQHRSWESTGRRCTRS